MTKTTALKISSAKDEPKITENLHNLMRNRNMNVNQLAQELGVPMMTIRRLILGQTTDPRISTLKLIANYFNVTVDSLMEENNQTIIKNSKKTTPQFIPIITWEIAKNIKSIKELDLIEWKEWQPISLGVEDAIGENAFALESRPSMYPRFPQETIFIIDPNVNPTDGDVVLVKIKENDEVTLRELIIDPPDWLLQPITSGSNILHYSKNDHEIIGVNLLTMLYNRRLYD